MKKYWYMTLIAFLICFFVGLNATGIKTYIFKPVDSQAEVDEIYIDTDGLIYKKIGATATRMDSNYILPAATTTVRGGVNAGIGLTITGTDSLGVILGTTSLRGGYKLGLGLTTTGDSIGIVDGTGLTITSNALGLDLASASARGGIKVGTGLSMTGDSLGVPLGRAQVVFTGGDPTPTIAGSNWFATSPASATTITDFDDGIDGQIIWIVCSSQSNVFDFTGASLAGHGVDITPDTSDVLQFIYNSGDGLWYLVGVNDASSTTTY